jgi:hypothetical protein
VKKSSKTKTKRAGTKKGAKRKAKRPLAVVNYSRAKRAVSMYGDAIRGLPGVTGLSVGPRFKKGKPTSEMTIRLHVATDEEKRFLKKNADEVGLKTHYGGVGIDIVVWNFRTSSSVDELPDGAGIVGGGGPGTLGTKVITRVRQRLTVVWLTAAHVASPSRPAGGNSINISRRGGGSPIGAVSAKHYFRDEEVDAAYIVPNGVRLRRPARGRTIRHLTAPDERKTVTMEGAETHNSTGEIISLFYSGTLADTGEDVTDHFLVRHPTGNFAIGGDSGAIVLFGEQLVGMLRAVDEEQRISVVSKLDVVRRHTGRLKRGFNL